jgi:hypothetical protein
MMAFLCADDQPPDDEPGWGDVGAGCASVLAVLVLRLWLLWLLCIPEQAGRPAPPVLRRAEQHRSCPSGPVPACRWRSS